MQPAFPVGTITILPVSSNVATTQYFDGYNSVWSIQYLVDIIYLSRDVVEKAKGSTALLCPLCRAPMYGPAPPFLCKPVTNDAVRFIVDCRFCCWSFGRVTRKAVGSVPLPFCNLLRSFIKLFYDYTLAIMLFYDYTLAIMLSWQMTKRPREDDDDNDGGKGPKVPPPVIPALLV